MVTVPPVFLSPPEPDSVIYPQSDGKPMAENTLQWEWIVLIKNGLETLFMERADVFVASDLLWYPVEGSPKICLAPDVMVVFGRPKGDRGSYLQWKEDGLPFQVVFEVLSPSNDVPEMTRKFDFYRRHGVLEYYIYDPGNLRKELRRTRLTGWHRKNSAESLLEVEEMDGWRSPLLGITFRHDPFKGMRLFYADGRTFESHQELARRADQNAQRTECLLAQLRAAGIDPDATL